MLKVKSPLPVQEILVPFTVTAFVALSVKEALPLQEIPVLTVIEFVALKATLVPDDSIVPKADACTLEQSFAVITQLPGKLAPLIISISAGSNNQSPTRPFGAKVLTKIPFTSKRYPDVSINPPLPPCAPPRAINDPATCVNAKGFAKLVKTIISPPSPRVNADTSRLAPDAIVVDTAGVKLCVRVLGPPPPIAILPPPASPLTSSLAVGLT